MDDNYYERGYGLAANRHPFASALLSSSPAAAETTSAPPYQRENLPAPGYLDATTLRRADEIGLERMAVTVLYATACKLYGVVADLLYAVWATAWNVFVFVLLPIVALDVIFRVWWAWRLRARKEEELRARDARTQRARKAQKKQRRLLLAETDARRVEEAGQGSHATRDENGIVEGHDGESVDAENDESDDKWNGDNENEGNDDSDDERNENGGNDDNDDERDDDRDEEQEDEDEEGMFRRREQEDAEEEELSEEMGREEGQAAYENGAKEDDNEDYEDEEDEDEEEGDDEDEDEVEDDDDEFDDDEEHRSHRPRRAVVRRAAGVEDRSHGTIWNILLFPVRKIAPSVLWVWGWMYEGMRQYIIHHPAYPAVRDLVHDIPPGCWPKVRTACRPIRRWARKNRRKIRDWIVRQPAYITAQFLIDDFPLLMHNLRDNEYTLRLNRTIEDWQRWVSRHQWVFAIMFGFLVLRAVIEDGRQRGAAQRISKIASEGAVLDWDELQHHFKVPKHAVIPRRKQGSNSHYRPEEEAGSFDDDERLDAAETVREEVFPDAVDGVVKDGSESSTAKAAAIDAKTALIEPMIATEGKREAVFTGAAFTVVETTIAGAIDTDEDISSAELDLSDPSLPVTPVTQVDWAHDFISDDAWAYSEWTWTTLKATRGDWMATVGGDTETIEGEATPTFKWPSEPVRYAWETETPRAWWRGDGELERLKTDEGPSWCFACQQWHCCEVMN